MFIFLPSHTSLSSIQYYLLFHHNILILIIKENHGVVKEERKSKVKMHWSSL
jgi:hypothetical protein